MQQFGYRARDRNGDEISGLIQAASLHDASEQLRSLEINVTSIGKVADAARRYEPDGPRPGRPPRDVHLRVRDMPGGRVLVIVGGIFTLVASLFVLAGVRLLFAGQAGGLFLALFPVIHLAMGVGMLWWVLGRRRKRMAIYRSGEVAMATVDGVGYNRSLRVNGRHPYEMTWSFEVDGHRFHDKRSSFDTRVVSFAPGDRLWVIYDLNDPEESVEWPPFTG